MKEVTPRNHNLRKEDLQASAVLIRQKYLHGKPVGKSNVAVAEVYLAENVAFCAGATSRGGRNSPLPKIPTPKSAGGQFEPSVDSRTRPNGLMNTDAEYKVLSEIADILEMFYDLQVQGQLYLYTNGTDLRGDRAEPKHGKKVSQAGFD